MQLKGIKFLSETDTEVIAQLIGIYLDKGLDTKEAVARALSRFLSITMRMILIYWFALTEVESTEQQ